MGDLTYSVPASIEKVRAKRPPLVVVMNDSCTSCSGSPACVPQCPVDCIHLIHRDGRPVRVYVDNDVCIGCLNCFSDTYRPRHVARGDIVAETARLNGMDISRKNGVCPWDAIEVHPFDAGEKRSAEFYEQPRRLVGSGT
jgi:ferredoxin